MAQRPSGHYELVESLDRFSLFDEAFSVMTPVAMQRRSLPTTALLRCSCVLQAGPRPSSRRARGMKSHDIADELGRMGAA
jgi:hypothetical protein